MKAVVCNEFGPPENLAVEEVDDPVPGPGQLLIDVHAAAVTFPDTLMLEDKYQFKTGLPYVPGTEGAGVVRAVGEGVEGWSVGDRAAGGLGTTGAYAEQMVFPAAAARRVPDNVSFEAVTGLNYAHGTTLYGLRYRADLQAGETMLVTGAAGAVGLSAIEIGKLMGARVIAAASSDEKLDLCREAGADETINYSTENLKERAKELSGGQGVDVVYDCVGGDKAEQALRAIGWEGRFLVIGFTAGIPAIPLNLALLKSCQIIGVFYGAMTGREPEKSAAISDQLIEWVAAGDLAPHVSARYTLDRASEALRALIDRKAAGKLVVTP
ncbi:MAG: NADPH:quinone oxidoreductase family protein [Actinomycetota bacterium]